MKRCLYPFNLIHVIAMFVLPLATFSTALAQGGTVNSGDSSAPEIDPSMVGGGLALLGGVILLLRDRRNH